jgi:putative modified peptide
VPSSEELQAAESQGAESRAAELLERLLTDDEFRASFRRDPSSACEQFDLPELATEFGGGAGASMFHTLEIRESRSSLAGAFMAAASEGTGAVDHLKNLHDNHLHGQAHRVVHHALTSPKLHAIDPDNLHGSGLTDHLVGSGSSEHLASSTDITTLLHNPHLTFSPEAHAALARGGADARLVSVLDDLTKEHQLQIGTLQVSHGAGGDSFDILSVDGQRVSQSNIYARDLANELASLDPSLRPAQIVTPWPIEAQGFTQGGGHDDRIHLIFDAPSSSAPAATHAAAGANTPMDTSTSPDTSTAPPEPSTTPPDPSTTPPASPTTPPPDPTTTPSGGGAPTTPPPDPSTTPPAAPATPPPDPTTTPSGGGAPTTPPPDPTTTPSGGGAPTTPAPDPTTTPSGGGSPPPDPTTTPPAAPTTPPSAPVQPLEPQGTSTPPPDPSTTPAASGTPPDPTTMPPAAPSTPPPDPTTTPSGAAATPPPEPATPPAGSGTPPADATTTPPPEPVTPVTTPGAPAPPPPTHQSVVLGAVQGHEGHSTFQFEVPGSGHAGGAVESLQGFDPNAAGGLPDATDTYPGDNASQQAIAAWMARQAHKAGLPAELPIMAALTESGLKNDNYGDRDSLGFFQMRTSIWNQGEYKGFSDHPELQLKWFINQALEVRRERLSQGDASYGQDKTKWGDWVADVEQPAAEYRGRYQTHLDQADSLLSAGGPGAAGAGGAAGPDPAAVAEAFQGAAGAAGSTAGVQALTIAERYIGTPYHWGGDTPQTGFDCSGLVEYSYGQLGIHVPRVAADQFNVGEHISNINDLKPGDIVFFKDSTGYVHHEGLYIGNHMFLHAPHTGDVVKISSLDEPYYKEQFAGGSDVTGLASGAPEPPGVGGGAPPVEPPPAPTSPTPDPAATPADQGTGNSGLFGAVQGGDGSGTPPPEPGGGTGSTVQILPAVPDPNG